MERVQTLKRSRLKTIRYFLFGIPFSPPSVVVIACVLLQAETPKMHS